MQYRFSKKLVFIAAFAVTSSPIRNDLGAQTRTLEFAGALVVESAAVYALRSSDHAYGLGLLGAMTGVILTDKLFLKKGGSIPRMAVGAAVGALAGLTASVIIARPSLNFYYGSTHNISSSRRFLASLALLAGPAFGAAVGYNPPREKTKSKRTFAKGRFRLSPPKLIFKMTDGGLCKLPMTTQQISILTLHF